MPYDGSSGRVFIRIWKDRRPAFLILEVSILKLLREVVFKPYPNMPVRN